MVVINLPIKCVAQENIPHFKEQAYALKKLDILNFSVIFAIK